MKNMTYHLLLVLCALALLTPGLYAQQESKTEAYATVDFLAPVRAWDGFGFNYVQTAQTFDYQKNPQDYGGFSVLNEKDKHAISELIFGDQGLKIGIVKMFLDPLHQHHEGGAYDHETTTVFMREFVKRGLQLTRARGEDLKIITTLYGPPGYMTLQKTTRGRDLDPAQEKNLNLYFIDWAKFLKNVEKLPLHYVSLHNEGEDWARWPADGSVEETHKQGHDYNLFWSPEQTTRVLKSLRPMMDKHGLSDVGITNGEYTNWYRFNAWGYAPFIVKDKTALKNLALITSHGFYVGDITARHWFAPHSSSGSDIIKSKKPDLHVWTTSTAWQVATRTEPRLYYMDEQFVKQIHGSIIDAKVNAIIPWAGIQRASQWNKPDPNPGCAIRVFDDGTWEIQKGYYYYKQVTIAGRPGMNVVESSVMSSELSILAFGKGNTRYDNAIVVVNQSDEPKQISINLKGHTASAFRAYRTSGKQNIELRNSAQKNAYEGENFLDIGMLKTEGDRLRYLTPPHSVTTFLESK